MQTPNYSINLSIRPPANPPEYPPAHHPSTYTHLPNLSLTHYHPSTYPSAHLPSTHPPTHLSAHLPTRQLTIHAPIHPPTYPSTHLFSTHLPIDSPTNPPIYPSTDCNPPSKSRVCLKQCKLLFCRRGRKPCYFVTLLVSCVVGTLSAFPLYPVVFLLYRFLLGAAVVSSYLSLFVLCMFHLFLSSSSCLSLLCVCSTCFYHLRPVSLCFVYVPLVFIVFALSLFALCVPQFFLSCSPLTSSIDFRYLSLFVLSVSQFV